MKTTKLMEIYVCDVCGKEMIDSPQHFLNGCNYGSNGVTYEPKVMGDYCDGCLKYAQDDWDENNKYGFVPERYDGYDKDIHQKEIQGIKKRMED